jgi:two-component system, NtrC family, nitrogen regulation response regulator NtrX
MEEVLFGRETSETAGSSRGYWNRRTAGFSTSTRWPTCRPARSPRSCACWSTSSSQRVGGTDKVKVDVRVISSTSRDLRPRSGRSVPRGTVSPAERGADRCRRWRSGARTSRPAGPHFIEHFHAARRACRCATGTSEAEAMLQAHALAGQRPPAAQRDRACADPGRRHDGPIEARDSVAGKPRPGRRGAADRRRAATLPLREARELFERNTC